MKHFSFDMYLST